MDSTSASLLCRLQSDDRELAWERFVELYAPLIYHWGVNHGLRSADAADLVQEVLAILVVKLPDFRYDPRRKFRGWLRTVTINKANDLHRRNRVRAATHSDETIDQVIVASETDLFGEAQYRAFLLRRLRRCIEAEFEPQTWQACWRQITQGKSAAQVGRELGISANAVRVSKCRVLRRLREELDGMID